MARSAAAVFAALVAVLTACASPQFHYVKNAGEKTYFRVPSSWTKVDKAAALDKLMIPEDPNAEARRQLIWSVAYDAHTEPSAAHLITGGGDQPAVYTGIHLLPEDQRGVVSLDRLRNYILPVTKTLREALQQQGVTIGSRELLQDEVLTPGGGLRGVRVVYDYETPTGMFTFDQTALVTDDSSRVYVMLIRCSSKCYRDRSDELSKIATSFKVRSR